jgi:hypothetical protein
MSNSPKRKRPAKEGGGGTVAANPRASAGGGVLKRASVRTSLAGVPAGGGGGLGEEDDLYQEPIRQVVRPHNQLDLTEAELKEEHTRVLTATDPNGEMQTVKAEVCCCCCLCCAVILVKSCACRKCHGASVASYCRCSRATALLISFVFPNPAVSDLGQTIRNLRQQLA